MYFLKPVYAILAGLLALGAATGLFFNVIPLEEVPKELVIFQTTDMHGQFIPYGTSGDMFGILREIRLFQQSVPPQNRLLIDCGDFALGSPEAALTQGELSLKWMNIAGYDVVVPGNHEFDGGPDRFYTLANTLKMPLVAANLQAEGLNIVPWLMFQRSGLHVAVIGILTREVSAYQFKFPNDSRIQFEHDWIKSVNRIMPEILDAKPDLIILACHSGIYTAENQLLRFLDAFPQIDLVLGGHSHVLIPGQQLSLRSYFVQCGVRCSHAAQIHIHAVPGRKIPPRITSSLIEITPDIPDSQFVNDMKKLKQKGMESVGYLKNEHFGSIKNTSALFHDAVRSVIPCDATLLGSPRFAPRNPLLTHLTLHQLSPFDDRLIILSLTPTEINAIPSMFSQLYAARQPVFSQTPTQNLIPEQRLKVVTSDYYAAGAGSYAQEFAHLAAQDSVCATVTSWNLRTAVQHYLSSSPTKEKEKP